MQVEGKVNAATVDTGEVQVITQYVDRVVMLGFIRARRQGGKAAGWVHVLDGVRSTGRATTRNDGHGVCAANQPLTHSAASENYCILVTCTPYLGRYLLGLRRNPDQSHGLLKPGRSPRPYTGTQLTRV